MSMQIRQCLSIGEAPYIKDVNFKAGAFVLF